MSRPVCPVLLQVIDMAFMCDLFQPVSLVLHLNFNIFKPVLPVSPVLSFFNLFSFFIFCLFLPFALTCFFFYEEKQKHYS